MNKQGGERVVEEGVDISQYRGQYLGQYLSLLIFFFLFLVIFYTLSWVGLIRLQPDVRIHIKWWVVFCVCVCVCVSKHTKTLLECILSLFVLL